MSEREHACDSARLRAQPAAHADFSDELTALSLSSASNDSGAQRKNAIFESSDALLREVEQYGRSAAKTAMLFMPTKGEFGAAATLATGIVFGLDELKAGTSTENQALDFAAGFAKGVGMRMCMTKMHNPQVSLLDKAMHMGFATRALDTGLSRRTYDQGISSGIEKTIVTTFNPTAMALDASLGFLGQRVAANLGEGMIQRYPVFASMITAGVLGAASGGFHEIQSQTQNANFYQLKLDKVLMRAMLQGTVDGFAAGPGGYMSVRLNRNTAAPSDGDTKRVPVADQIREPATARGDAAGGTQKVAALLDGVGRTFDRTTDGGVQHFIVTRGDLRSILGGTGTVALQVKPISERGTIGAEQPLLLGHLDGKQSLNLGLLEPGARIASCNPQLLPASLRQRHLFNATEGPIYLATDGNNRMSLATRLELLPAAEHRLALGKERHFASIEEMLKHPAVLRDLAESSKYLQPGRIKRWARAMAEEWTYEPRVVLDDGVPKGYMVGGEQLTIPLKGDNAPFLKMSTIGWKNSWGEREFALGVKDAAVIEGPHRIKLPDGETNYWYVQERLRPLELKDLPVVDRFAKALDKDGSYRFWDFLDPEHKVSQFGFRLTSSGELVMKDGKPVMALLDYNSIVRKNATPLEPREPSN